MTAVGTVIAGRYRLVDQLAVGGMGSVWRAWDELLERPVAVKQLLTQPGLSHEDTDTARMRIIREARITARLHHPNAVTLYDVVEDERHPCLIMQYVPSKSLSTLIRENGPVGVRFATSIGAELAAALATAHRVGVVHRDVKPGNVLITDDGSAKLTDFGISHAVGDVTLTSTGVLTGTPAFLAPEVARGEPSGFPADVFSLGATLYAALEGFPPFGTDPNPMAVLHRVASGKMLPPQQSGPLTPLITRMLSTDPYARPPMTDVGATLNGRLTQDRGHAEGRERSTFALTVREETEPSPGLRVPAGHSTPPPNAPSSGEPARTLAAPMPILPSGDPARDSAASGRHAHSPSPTGGPSSGGSSAGGSVDGGSFSGSPASGGPARTASTPALPPSGSGRSPRRVAVLVAGALAALVAVITVVGYLATRSGVDATAAGDPTGTSASSPAARASSPTTPPPSTAGPGTGGAAPVPAGSVSSAAPATTPAQSTAEQSTARQPSTTKPPPSGQRSSSRATTAKSTPEQSTPAAPAGDPANGRSGQLAAAITDYYAVMPANTDEGWSRLTANFQSGIARNRDYYESFWAGIDRVTATDVTATPPDTAEATITYYFKDGRVSTERTVFSLVQDGGSLKIDNSSVVGTS